jgi:hypothetical protein
LIYGVIFAFAAVGLPFGAKLDMVQKSELYRISGTVESMSRTNVPRAGSMLNIFVRDGGRLHHLTQDDLFSEVPALRSLQAGDNVTALVRRDPFGRNLEWVWEVQSAGVTILSYEQTQKFLELETERMRVIARWASVLSIGFFAAAVVFRVYFGTWRGSTKRKESQPSAAIDGNS